MEWKENFGLLNSEVHISKLITNQSNRIILCKNAKAHFHQQITKLRFTITFQNQVGVRRSGASSVALGYGAVTKGPILPLMFDKFEQ